MAPLIFDFVSYRNQLEACKKTFGLVPHPAFERLEAPSGQPMTTPWIVCAVGRPAQHAKPANHFTFGAEPPMPAPRSVPPFPSLDVEPPERSIRDAREVRRNCEFTQTDSAWANYSAPAAAPYPAIYHEDEDREGWRGRIVNWIVERVFPFYLLQDLAEWLDEGPRIARAIIAACCGGLVLMALRHEPGAWEPISARIAVGWAWALVAGAVVLGGWKGPGLLGWLVHFSTRLLALLSFVGTACTVIGGVTYLVVLLATR